MQNNQMNAYIYGTISIAIVSLLSLVGAVMIPCLKTGSRQRWMHVFIALAIATLASDALMHLIPQALGVHNHAHEVDEHADHDHTTNPEQFFDINPTVSDYDDHNHADLDHAGHDHAGHDHDHRKKREAGHVHDDGDNWEEKILLLRMCVVIASIYLFYLFETIAHGISESRKQKRTGPRISPAVYTEPIPVWDRPGRMDMITFPEPSKLGQSSGSAYINGGVPTHLATQWTAQHISENPSMKSLDSVMYATPSTTSNSSRDLVPSTGSNSDDDPPLCLGFRPIAFMILIGDAVHNFADGLAVGAAFAHSNASGLATSIAICTHELPHEIGDFAILIDSGLPVCKALLLNLISSLTAFIGLYVGIAVGQGEEARTWIFALAAGMFLYVALVDMLPHLKHTDSTDPFYVQLALQNIGFISGFVLMFLVGWFEHDIKV